MCELKSKEEEAGAPEVEIVVEDLVVSVLFASGVFS